MSDGPDPGVFPCIDSLALKVQELRRAGLLSGRQPLLRIDNRTRAAEAPFQFDAVAGQLHRRDCPTISGRVASALYAYWQIEDADLQVACPRCRPVPDEHRPDDPEFASDLLFGVLSVVAQFGEVLRERGREYRGSSEGRDLQSQIGGLYRGLGSGQKKAVEAVLSSLTELTIALRGVEHGLNGASANGAADEESETKARRRAPVEQHDRSD